MKDIGKARRKEHHKEKPLRLTLEVPDLLATLTPPTLDVLELDQAGKVPTTGQKGRLELRNNQSKTKTDASEDDTNPLRQLETSHLTTNLLPPIERIWTGRMDPFIRYPIKMDHRSLQLMDHGKPYLFTAPY
jgi:hypothetical protein